MATFRGFQPHDFDAYAPQKWRSNVYNLERMQVKDKLLCLGRDVSPLVPAPDALPLTLESSVEHPALWNGNQVTEQALYFLRGEAERQELHGRIVRTKSLSSLLADRAPYRDHVHLCLILRHEDLTVGLALHREAVVDWQNASRRAADAWQLQSFLERVHHIDPAFLVSLHGGETIAPNQLTAEALREALSAETTPKTGPAKPVLRVLRRYSRTDPYLAEPAFTDRIREDIGALLPLYAFLAWSHQHDLVSVKEGIKEEKKAKKARGLTRDDAVRVTRGLFSGKTGVILEVDDRGGLRVRLGTMVVKLDAADVAPLG